MWIIYLTGKFFLQRGMKSTIPLIRFKKMYGGEKPRYGGKSYQITLKLVKKKSKKK